MISAGIPTIPIIIYARPRNIQKCISHLNIEDESLGDSKMTHTHTHKKAKGFSQRDKPQNHSGFSFVFLVTFGIQLKHDTFYLKKDVLLVGKKSFNLDLLWIIGW